jgi:hypothetical protein
MVLLARFTARYFFLCSDCGTFVLLAFEKRQLTLKLRVARESSRFERYNLLPIRKFSLLQDDFELA